jgi:four helix bundle protein
MITSYKDLIVWKKSFQLSVDVYHSTKKYPKEELFGLVSQSRRSAFSIPSNIAEGYGRHRKGEYIHFLDIAFGSTAELETQLLLAREIKILDSKDFLLLNSTLQEVLAMLNSLISKLKSS